MWPSRIIEVLGGVQQNDALLNLGTTIAIFIPADQLWRAASYYVQSARLLAAKNTFGAAMPMLAKAAPTPFLMVWGLVYPLIMHGSAMLVFARRDH